MHLQSYLKNVFWGLNEVTLFIVIIFYLEMKTDIQFNIQQALLKCFFFNTT